MVALAAVGTLKLPWPPIDETKDALKGSKLLYCSNGNVNKLNVCQVTGYWGKIIEVIGIWQKETTVDQFTVRMQGSSRALLDVTVWVLSLSFNQRPDWPPEPGNWTSVFIFDFLSFILATGLIGIDPCLTFKAQRCTLLSWTQYLKGEKKKEIQKRREKTKNGKLRDWHLTRKDNKQALLQLVGLSQKCWSVQYVLSRLVRCAVGMVSIIAFTVEEHYFFRCRNVMLSIVSFV